MARIFITGSSDGLGQMAAALLVAEGHKVVLHARTNQRADAAMAAVPDAEAVLTADLASIKETIGLAEQLNRLGPFDAIIHNAGIGLSEKEKITTVDGLPHVFAINSLAPYILTALTHPPERLVYVSSGMHRQGDTSLADLCWETKPWNGYNAYVDSKLHNLLLMLATSRRFPASFVNAIEPGWVPTKMGGAAATDDLAKGPVTQSWLAASDDPDVFVTGKYFFHQRLLDFLPEAAEIDIQEKFMSECARLSGIVTVGP